MDRKEIMREKMGDDFWILELGERVAVDLKDRIDEAFDAFEIPKVRAMAMAVLSIISVVGRETPAELAAKMASENGDLELKARAIALALFFKDYLAGVESRAK